MNVQNKYNGSTALMEASTSGFADTVRLLVNAGE